MRIAVDAWELGGRPTGVGRYLRALLSEWQSLTLASPHRFVLFGPPGAGPVLPEVGDGGARFETRKIGRAERGRTFWEQWDLPRALGREAADVLFAPAYGAPLASRVPVVLTIHDVSFAAHPEWFRPRERWRRLWLARLAARRAAMVITVSTFSAGEISRHLHVEPARIAVVPSGIPRLLAPPPGDVPIRRANEVRPSDREPLVVFVGSVFNRRRVPDLIRAFARVGSTRPMARLEVVGENRTYPHEDLARVAAEAGVSDRVALRAFVDDGQLAALYDRASVFVFLSEYEGFGFTPLEAMSRGVPAVVLDTPVAREIYQDGALYVDRGDLDGTAMAIGRVLDEPQLRTDLVHRGSRVLSSYSWTKAAERTLEVLVDAVRGSRATPARGPR